MKLNVEFDYEINNQKYKIKAILIDNEIAHIESIIDKVTGDLYDYYYIDDDILIEEIEKYALTFWYEKLDEHNEEIRNSLLNYTKFK
jgi:hypothetical protein